MTDRPRKPISTAASVRRRSESECPDPQPDEQLPAWTPLDEMIRHLTRGDQTDAERPEADEPPGFPLRRPDPVTVPVDPAQLRWALHEKRDMLRRGKWLIVSVTAVMLSVALMVTALTPDEFEARTVLAFDIDRPEIGELDARSSVPGLEERRLLNEILILRQAPEIAERTARRIIATGQPADLLQRLGVDVPERQLARHLQAAVIRVEPDGAQPDVVHVIARAPTGGEASLIADMYAGEFVARSKETGQVALLSARAFLEAKRRDAHAALARIQLDLSELHGSEVTTDPGSNTGTTVPEIARMELELERERIEHHLRRSALRAIENEMVELLPAGHQHVTVAERELKQIDERIGFLISTIESIYELEPDLRTHLLTMQVAGLERVLIDLRNQRHTLTARYVEEVAAAGAIELGSSSPGSRHVVELLHRIDSERASLAGSEIKLQTLEERLSEATSNSAEPPAEARVAALRHRRDAMEQRVDYLTQRAEEALIAEGSEYGFASIVGPAVEPRRPARPRAAANLLVGLALGLLVGLGAAALRYRLDDVIYGPRDLRVGELALVGVIPAAPTPGRPDHHPPHDREAYRRLLAKLQSSGNGRPPRTVLIAGAESGAGASTVARRLAVEAARSDRRTLLIDADIHHPTVQYALRPLREVHRHGQQAPLAYWPTEVPNLSALTPRESLGITNAVWTRERVRTLLGGIGDAFDLIVIDAAPALTSADACVIAAETAVTVLVARAGTTQESSLLQAASELRASGGSVIGAVLNGFHFALASGYRHAFDYGGAAAPSFRSPLSADGPASGKSRIRTADGARKARL